MANAKRVLMIVTSHGDIDGEPTTGIWFSEFSEPLTVLRQAGVLITVASPRGGPAPVDPRGFPNANEIVQVRDALQLLNATRQLGKMREVDFDGVFIPGGHGPMFDLATDRTTKQLLSAFWAANKPIGSVCHGPASLLNVRLEDGSTLLQNRLVTGFTKGEDEADPLFEHMPFSLQERMSAEGARFIEQPPRSVHVEVDGKLVTGQNPASAAATAEEFLASLHS